MPLISNNSAASRRSQTSAECNCATIALLIVCGCLSLMRSCRCYHAVNMLDIAFDERVAAARSSISKRKLLGLKNGVTGTCAKPN
jgi:hypothetical protein